MGRPKKSSETRQLRRMRPASTPEERENQLISYATDRAEQQLIDGTASAQVIVHFLRLGTAKAKEETEKLKRENQLLEAKTAAIKAGQRSEEMFERALKAFSMYRGQSSENEENEEYYE